MTADAPVRSARLEARIAPQALAAVKRAAELQGRSVSDFVVAAAHEAAQRTLEQASLLRLSAADQERVADLLAAPPAAGPALTRAFDSRRELIVGAE